MRSRSLSSSTPTYSRTSTAFCKRLGGLNTNEPCTSTAEPPDHKVVGTGGWCRWWTLEVKGVKIKKESYQTWLTCGIVDAAEGNQQNATLTIPESKT